jgi:hypothetical protein
VGDRAITSVIRNVTMLTLSSSGSRKLSADSPAAMPLPG